MKILFIGCVEFSRKALECLLNLDFIEVVGIVTKNDSKINSDFVSLEELAKIKYIPYIFSDNSDNHIILEFAKKVKADIAYCFGWSYLLEEKFIDLFPKGVVGFHPAALPQNRGRHPIIWALALGLSETAISFFKINEYADAGGIISQKKLPIYYEDDARSLYDRVVREALKEIPIFTARLAAGNEELQFQDEAKANVWRKRSKMDGQIDWRMSSRAIYNLVRSLNKPYVGAHCIYKTNEVKIWAVRELEIDSSFNNLEPGKVVKVVKDKIWVKCYEGAIEILSHDFAIIPKEGEYLL